MAETATVFFLVGNTCRWSEGRKFPVVAKLIHEIPNHKKRVKKKSSAKEGRKRSSERVRES